MDDLTITVYCLCDDLLKAFHHPEVITTALVAALYFRGNFESARVLLHEQAYIPRMLSKSRFLRRLQRIRSLLLTSFSVLGETWKELNRESICVFDTFPIPVCDNYRIPHAKVYPTEDYRGYQAGKKRYFYGVKLHLLVTREGQPVEFFLTPGSYSDTTGLQWFDFDLPAGSTVYGDKAYNVYALEDILHAVGIDLLPMRKQNSKRSAPTWLCYLQAHYRKMIETTGSLIERLLPQSIHAVTALGFELKIVLFVVACSFNQL